jgi:hypothetical protein
MIQVLVSAGRSQPFMHCYVDFFRLSPAVPQQVIFQRRSLSLNMLGIVARRVV